MRFLFFALFFFTTLAHAQKNVSSQAFQSSVRPALSGILSDFYQMVLLFPDYPKELVGLVRELENLGPDKEALREKCPKTIQPLCLANINSIREILLSLETKTLKLISDQKMSSSLHLNPLGGLRLIFEFQSDLEEIKGELDNTALMMKANISQKRETFAVLKKLDELSTFLSLTIVEYVPYLYKEDFRHFYFNFVHPLQQQISRQNNFEFVNRNINALNFAINLLNMNLTKRNKKTPEGMSPYLALIHNRWNSILRFYY